MHNDTELGSAERSEILQERLQATMTPQRAAAQQGEDRAGVPDKNAVMYSPRVFVGICLGLLGFAIFTYHETGALSVTLLHTIVAGILLQSAYFLVVVYLVMRRVKARAAAVRRRAREAELTPHDGHSPPPEPF